MKMVMSICIILVLVSTCCAQVELFMGAALTHEQKMQDLDNSTKQSLFMGAGALEVTFVSTQAEEFQAVPYRGDHVPPQPTQKPQSPPLKSHPEQDHVQAPQQSPAQAMAPYVMYSAPVYRQAPVRRGLFRGGDGRGIFRGGLRRGLFGGC